MKPFLRIIVKLIGAVAHGAIALAVILMIFAGYWMQVDDEPTQADYILPLAGDSHRLFKAAELYHQGYAPTILLSNAETLPPTRLKRLEWEFGYPRYTNAQYKKLLLENLGLGNAPREEFGNGHISTVEEAEALRKYLAGRRTRLLIVTSPYHARRAKIIFDDVLPNCTITVVTNKEGSFGKQWWKDQKEAQLLVLEFAKTLHYLAGGVFRSSD